MTANTNRYYDQDESNFINYNQDYLENEFLNASESDDLDEDFDEEDLDENDLDDDLIEDYDENDREPETFSDDAYKID